MTHAPATLGKSDSPSEEPVESALHDYYQNTLDTQEMLTIVELAAAKATQAFEHINRPRNASLFSRLQTTLHTITKVKTPKVDQL